MDIRDKKALIQDASGNAIQITELHFEQAHPGRRWSASECPEERHYAHAVLENLSNGELPDFTGYMVEWRDEAGNLISGSLAHEGIKAVLEGYYQPEGLYDKPAMLLIYDTYTAGAQPTPTAAPVIAPEQKAVTATFNTSEWESSSYQPRRGGRQENRNSPDLTGLGLAIYDTQGKRWTISSIWFVEENDSGQYSTEYNIGMRNDSRAKGDFTGYNVSLTDENGNMGGGNWERPDSKQELGLAYIKGRIKADGEGTITVRIWDTYEPSLDPNR